MNNIANANTQDISNICEDRDPPRSIHGRAHVPTPLPLITEISVTLLTNPTSDLSTPVTIWPAGFELIGDSRYIRSR